MIINNIFFMDLDLHLNNMFRILVERPDPVKQWKVTDGVRKSFKEMCVKWLLETIYRVENPLGSNVW